MRKLVKSVPWRDVVIGLVVLALVPLLLSYGISRSYDINQLPWLIGLFVFCWIVLFNWLIVWPELKSRPAEKPLQKPSDNRPRRVGRQNKLEQPAFAERVAAKKTLETALHASREQLASLKLAIARLNEGRRPPGARNNLKIAAQRLKLVAKDLRDSLERVKKFNGLWEEAGSKEVGELIREVEEVWRMSDLLKDQRFGAMGGIFDEKMTS